MDFHPMTGVLVRGTGQGHESTESSHPERDLHEHPDSRDDWMSVVPSSGSPCKRGHMEKLLRTL